MPYKVKPTGLNIKESDRVVEDGSLLESVNLQWREGSLRPLPERLLSHIATGGFTNIIFHKVGDENQINVLGFKEKFNSTFLAFDLSGGLTGQGLPGDRMLTWFGTIIDGVFSSTTERQLGVHNTEGMSYTILNGNLYFMGDGSNANEEYYFRLQFNETANEYEGKDMYAWKSLIPYYPKQVAVDITGEKKANNVLTYAGAVLVRFALVLKSGEVVLHSPVYAFTLHGINTSDDPILKGDAVENIHSMINLNLEFSDMITFGNEVSAINIYASVPYYKSEFKKDVSSIYPISLVSDEELKGEIVTMSEKPFYLVETIERPKTDAMIMLTAGGIDPEFKVREHGTTTEIQYSAVDIVSIAGGDIMPIDNFTHLKLYGKLSSANGRILISRPTTLLTGENIKANATTDVPSSTGFEVETEDGAVSGVAQGIDKGYQVFQSSYGFTIAVSRGILSYPDMRGSKVGIGEVADGEIYMYDCRKNNLHNMSMSFDFYRIDVDKGTIVVPGSGTEFTASINSGTAFNYMTLLHTTIPESYAARPFYTSMNRIQMSAAGEFSVLPARHSYRVGEGMIIAVGANSVNPSNADIIAPLIIGTTDGVYTMNTDPTGQVLVSSITKTASMPYVSEETLQIDGSIIFVSDRGLMSINNGDIINLTDDAFPRKGSGGFPPSDTVFPNYDTLTSEVLQGNDFFISDIVDYMRGAIFAYDGNRGYLWCSNPSKNFSLIYNVATKTWGMSTFVFYSKSEYFSIIKEQGKEMFTRYMVQSKTSESMYILSGEDSSMQVMVHLLTRALSFGSPDAYKLLSRMAIRCVLTREGATPAGFVAVGLWGKQDPNRYKSAIPIVAIKDSSDESFPHGVRHDIPVNCRKGKYKSVVVSLSGKLLPSSTIEGFEFDVRLVNENKLR